MENFKFNGKILLKGEIGYFVTSMLQTALAVLYLVTYLMPVYILKTFIGDGGIKFLDTEDGNTYFVIAIVFVSIYLASVFFTKKYMSRLIYAALLVYFAVVLIVYITDLGDSFLGANIVPGIGMIFEFILLPLMLILLTSEKVRNKVSEIFTK